MLSQHKVITQNIYIFEVGSSSEQLLFQKKNFF